MPKARAAPDEQADGRRFTGSYLRPRVSIERHAKLPKRLVALQAESMSPEASRSSRRAGAGDLLNSALSECLSGLLLFVELRQEKRTSNQDSEMDPSKAFLSGSRGRSRNNKRPHR